MSASTWPSVLSTLLAGSDLNSEASTWAMEQILGGEATPSQIAGFVVALRSKGATVDEITAFVETMYRHAAPMAVDGRVVDIVGTGGDGARTVNISTMAAVTIAGAGIRVVKHGNRASSSQSGSADVLESLGVRLDVPVNDLGKVLDAVGITFCFAPAFHPSMRFAGPTRKELGVPTVFNILGPLANPARVRHYLIGIGDAAMAAKMVRVLAANGAEQAWVVTGDGPIDEVSLTGPTQVQTLAADGTVGHHELTPELVGLSCVEADELAGGDAARNVEIFAAVLAGETGPLRDIVLLNTAAALVVTEIAGDMRDGIVRAAASIDSGAAQRVLDTVRRIVNAA